MIHTLGAERLATVSHGTYDRLFSRYWIPLDGASNHCRTGHCERSHFGDRKPGAVGLSLQGQAVALSADGNTAIVGGLGDNDYTGAIWIFTRSNGVWSQQGNKLVGSSRNAGWRVHTLVAEARKNRKPGLAFSGLSCIGQFREPQCAKKRIG
jgi:flagellar basal body rod protein FlgF